MAKRLKQEIVIIKPLYLLAIAGKKSCPMIVGMTVGIWLITVGLCDVCVMVMCVGAPTDAPPIVRM